VGNLNIGPDDRPALKSYFATTDRQLGWWVVAAKGEA
jgi:hypothetical protein